MMRLLRQAGLAALPAVAGHELALSPQALDECALVGVVAQLGFDGGLFSGAHASKCCMHGASADCQRECVVTQASGPCWPIQNGSLHQIGADA